ncbi:hypothetical protein KCU71_g25, partial [Aureobasidium melanogenum]
MPLLSIRRFGLVRTQTSALIRVNGYLDVSTSQVHCLIGRAGRWTQLRRQRRGQCQRKLRDGRAFGHATLRCLCEDTKALSFSIIRSSAEGGLADRNPKIRAQLDGRQW